jgi:hypothetical protein
MDTYDELIRNRMYARDKFRKNVYTQVVEFVRDTR